MLIDFFSQNLPQRSSEERKLILEELEDSVLVTESYKKYGYDYFDNKTYGVGYGGYHYDGRYKLAVEKMINHYDLRPGDSVLEIGCAKGFLLFEFFQYGLEVYGVEISEYAIEHAHPVVKDSIRNMDARRLEFEDNSFSLVYAKEVLPHLPEQHLNIVISACNRVSKGNVFFEIQCANSEISKELFAKWDSNHQVIQDMVWWEDLFHESGIPCDRNYKELF